MLEMLTPPQNNAQQHSHVQQNQAASAKDHTVLPKSQTVQAPAHADKANQDQYNVSSDEGRRAKVEMAARDFIANAYVVSDHSVTIFKDSTGQFITRLRNLKDGRVSYYPEPDMLRMSVPSYGGDVKMLKINA